MPEITDNVPGRFKGSIVFMQMIRDCLSSMESSSVPPGDFMPWEGATLARETILHWFNEEYKPYPLAKRKERVMARIHRWIEMELKKSPSAAALKDRKKKAAQREKSYANKWPKYEPLLLYKQMFKAVKTTGGWPEEALSGIPAAVLKSTQSDLKKDVIREEDLPALLYMHYLLNDITGNSALTISSSTKRRISPRFRWRCWTCLCGDTPSRFWATCRKGSTPTAASTAGRK